MKNIYTLLLIAISTIFSSYGQGGIEGSVKSDSGILLYGATVSLISLPDSTLLSVKIADDEGKFIFEDFDVNSGQKKIIASMPGYEDNSIDVHSNSGNILILKKKSTELEEIVVVGRTGDLKTKAGKFIYTPGTIARSMPSAYGALTITPLLENSGESFSILSKSGAAKIYINGREPKESITEIMAMLQSIPPTNIKRIEIIMDPGAIVEGDFKGGIIDIYVTLPNEGLLGQFQQSMQSNFNTFPGTATRQFIGYQKNRFHGSGAIFYAQSTTNSKSESLYNYTDTETTITNNTKSTGHNNNINANLNFYVDLTPKSLIGVSLVANTYESYTRNRISTLTESVTGTSESNYQIRDVFPMKRPDISAAAYYTYNIDDAGSFFDIDLSFGKARNKTFRDMDFSGSYEREKYQERFRNYAAIAKFKKNFKENGVLQAGVTYVNNNTSKRVNYTQAVAYSDFMYYRNSIRAYASYDRNFGRYLSASVGMRWEYNNYQMRNRPSGEEHNMHYGDFLPSLNLAWSLPNGNHSFSLGYNRFINNPSFDALNPELKLSTDNTAYQGNPYLKSYTTDAAGIRYTLFKHFIISTNFATSKNYYTGLIVKDNMTIQTPMIGGRYHHANIIPMYFNDFFNFWNFTAFCQFDYDHVKADDPTICMANWSITGGIKNNFRLTSDGKYFLSLHYYYKSKTKSSLSVTDDLHLLLLGFNANWGKWNFSFNLDNILNSRPKTRYYYPDYSSFTVNRGNAISMYVGISYIFGNMKVKAADNRYVEE